MGIDYQAFYQKNAFIKNDIISRDNNTFIENPDFENIDEIISNKIINIDSKIQLSLIFFFN